MKTDFKRWGGNNVVCVIEFSMKIVVCILYLSTSCVLRDMELDPNTIKASKVKVGQPDVDQNLSVTTQQGKFSCFIFKRTFLAYSIPILRRLSSLSFTLFKHL